MRHTNTHTYTKKTQNKQNNNIPSVEGTEVNTNIFGSKTYRVDEMDRKTPTDLHTESLLGLWCVP